MELQMSQEHISPLHMFDKLSKEEQFNWSLSGYGYRRSKYRSPGFCSKCVLPEWGEAYVMNFGTEHEPSNCRNPPFCDIHEKVGHAPTPKCHAHCQHCRRRGHIMRFCRKIKECVLCNKKGHNPLNCFIYSNSMYSYMARTKELNRCVDCLTLFTTDTNRCTHCNCKRIYLHRWTEDTESQTETNATTDQESQMELQQMETIINDQKLETEEIRKQVAVLEGKLENSISTINELNWQLNNTVKEKEQELQKVNKLDSLCKEKEMELRKLQLIISQKDIELEQHRKTSAQPSQTVPATAQQPCSNPIPTVNQLEHMRETNYMKTMLTDLQNQQQKLFVIVNLLYNKTKAQDMSRPNYPSFNPYMGPYDTGQYFNKLKML